MSSTQTLSRVLAASLILLAAPAIFAQSAELKVWYSMVDPQGSNRPGVTEIDELELDSENGYGAALNFYWSDRFSTEFAGYVVNSNVSRSLGTAPAVALGELEMIPLTATLQFHLLPRGRFDVYAGAGVAYVLFDNVENAGDVGGIDLQQVEFEDDYGFLGNAGVSLGITNNFAINIDAKYVPLKSSATARYTTASGQEFDFEVNPLIVSAGISLRY